MYKMAAVQVRLVQDREIAYKAAIDGVDQAANAARALIGDDADREYFAVLHLNQRNKVVSACIVSVGTVSATLVHPREVFKSAILANASRIVLVHNHPSGDPSPSQEDWVITSNLIDAGKILGITICDHIVLGDKNYNSLRELNPRLGWDE